MARGIRVAVLGGGSWGTTVASLAARHTDTVLWARRASTVEGVNERHENPDYLPGLALHSRLTATAALEEGGLRRRRDRDGACRRRRCG